MLPTNPNNTLPVQPRALDVEMVSLTHQTTTTALTAAGDAYLNLDHDLETGHNPYRAAYSTMAQAATAQLIDTEAQLIDTDNETPCGEKPLFDNEQAEARLPARHVTFRDRIASFISPVTSFLARSYTGSAPVAPAPEARPSMKDLLNGQYATSLKVKEFMFGSLGYQFFKFFSFLANANTNTLIGRISTLETGAAAVKQAANRVARALSDDTLILDAIERKQETLDKGTLLNTSKAANKELAAGIHNLMDVAHAFVIKQKPVERYFLTNHTAYTKVLGTLIQNNTVGVKVTDEQIQTLSNLNFMAGSTVRDIAKTFAKQVEKALAEAKNCRILLEKLRLKKTLSWPAFLRNLDVNL